MSLTQPSGSASITLLTADGSWACMWLWNLRMTASVTRVGLSSPALPNGSRTSGSDGYMMLRVRMLPAQRRRLDAARRLALRRRLVERVVELLAELALGQGHVEELGGVAEVRRRTCESWCDDRLDDVVLRLAQADLGTLVESGRPERDAHRPHIVDGLDEADDVAQLGC